MAEQAFSADVALSLIVEDREIQLAQVGPDFFIVQEDCERIQAQQAELIIRIDDNIEKTSIRLTDDIQGTRSRVGYARCEVSTTPG